MKKSNLVLKFKEYTAKIEKGSKVSIYIKGTDRTLAIVAELSSLVINNTISKRTSQNKHRTKGKQETVIKTPKSSI